jgi:anti-anti-sigma factor
MMRMVVTELDSPRGLKLAGELDMSTAPLLSDALDPQLAQGGDITLDLADLRFMDSTGLQVLIRSALTLGERGRLILRSPGNLVQSILELAVRTDKIPNLVIKKEE